GVSVTTVRRWVERAQAGGPLEDRSSAPKRIPHRTSPRLVTAIEALRRLRMTAVEIAESLELALSTVSAWLKRIGLGKRSRVERGCVPARGDELVRGARGQGRARHGRQRLVLSIARPRPRLPRAWPAAQLHAALPAAHERQGRALHPDADRKVGLRPDLRQL